ncbi:unnamed protein product [Orchesella dallaii]|uniref:CRIB domain-containing protein n=1 Tax=Orchesella dallaii TaxID=48710 RepID=A0ABP1Q4T2_9HEXA
MASTPPPFPVILPPLPNFSKVASEQSYKSLEELRLHVLRKYRREIVNKVRFSDVSQQLIHCGLVSKEECFEICKMPVAQQMSQCYQKVHDIMDILICQRKVGITNTSLDESSQESEREQLQAASHNERQNELAKDIWNNFLIALKCQHAPIASKMQSELDKSKSSDTESKLKRKNSNNVGTPSRLKKEDIGTPTRFQHVQHYGLISRTRSVDIVDFNRNVVETKEKEGEGKSDEQPNEKDADLQEFFKRAGVLPRHLENPKTRQVIFKFIEDHGGMEKIRREVRAPPRASSSDSNLTLIGSAAGNHYNNSSESNANKFSTTSNIEHPAFTSPPPPYAPPSVPFEPTPKPKPNMDLYNF